MKYFLLLSFVLLTPLFALAAEAGQFVPLTSLPGLAEGGNAETMTVFLNSLYKICIGAAAAIAVLQIIRAGILFMTNKGSISENEQARSLVQGAVLGLLLVLSPVIVFTIINPKILTLDFGVAALKQDKPADANLGASEVEQGTNTDNEVTNKICSIYKDELYTPLTENQSCSQKHGDGYTKIDDICCTSTFQSGFYCCARGKDYVPPPIDPSTMPASFSFIARDTAEPMCQYPEETRGFDTLSECQSKFAEVSNDPNAVVTKSCTGTLFSPPFPRNRAKEIMSLPLCET